MVGSAVLIYINNPVRKQPGEILAHGVRSKRIFISSVDAKGRDNGLGVARGQAQLGLPESL